MSTTTSEQYKEFQDRFKTLARKHPEIIKNTLSNIFTMRLIGNKTHGDLAEIGITEFINQFMKDYECKHVGKDLFRAKEHEEDIVITKTSTGEEIPVSLKAYGDGPLQLSTDKESLLFNNLKKFRKSYGDAIEDKNAINDIFLSDEFQSLNSINVMPLIYREEQKQCNIMVFDFEKMKKDTTRILYIDKGNNYDKESQKVIKGGSRKHPIYMFINDNGEYICEVRYGGASANALQRGLWTHTERASGYFNSLTNGWISYQPNHILVKLIRLALNSTESKHKDVMALLQQDIDDIRQNI